MRHHHNKPGKPGRRRALELIASAGPAGCSAAVLAAHGYRVGDLLELMHAGLVPNERRADFRGAYDLSRVTITAQGREVLAKAMA